MIWAEYPSRAGLAEGLAAAVARDLVGVIAAQGRACLCLAGGTTPAPMFQILAQAELDWSKVVVLPTDERWVPPSDPRSNAALIAGSLLQGRAAAARYVSLYAAGAGPQEGLADLAGKISAALPISVLVAGMGADLHTASLFPDASNIASALAGDAPPLMVMHPPSQPEARITLTAPVLRAAGARHVMITGAEKRAALMGLAGQAAIDAPISVILDGATVHWAG